MEAACLSESGSHSLSSVQRAQCSAAGARWRVEELTEDCSGRIITGETGLAHTRTINCQLISIRYTSFVRSCRRAGEARRRGGRCQCRQPLHDRDGRSSMSGGMISPIVDDEGCDFLCSEEQKSAELIEIEAHRQGMAGGDAGGRWAQLLTFHVD
jgi:hypothetical protein